MDPYGSILGFLNRSRYSVVVETGKFEVDYEIPPRGQVLTARGFGFEKKSLVGVYCLYVSQKTLLLW
jgi:hypothetical protein